MFSEVSVLESPEFWKSVAFVLSVLTVIVPVWRFCRKRLYENKAQIINRINEADNLLHAARKALKESQKKQQKVQTDQQQIINEAKSTVKQLKVTADEELSEKILQRQQEYEERVCLIRENGLKQLKERVLDIAVDTTKSVLTDKMVLQQNNDVFVEKSLLDLQQMLQNSKNVEMLKSMILLEEG